jgi:hypothetical protein
MSCKMPGIDSVGKEIEKIRTGALRYLILNISPEEPLTLSVVHSGGEVSGPSAKTMLRQEDLKGMFEECKAKMNENEPYIVIYFFTQLMDGGIQKNTMCLISYIPANLGALKNVIYTTTSLQLKNEFDIMFYMVLNDKMQLSFENISLKCLNLGIK